MRVIADAFRRAARVISPDIARTYTEVLAERKLAEGEADDLEEAIVSARVEIAALGLLDDLPQDLDREADKLAKAWLTTYRVDIRALAHDRQEAYRQVQQMSAEPQDLDLVKPEAKDEPTSARESDKITPLPTYKSHLLCDEAGGYPVALNSWEQTVLTTEAKRTGFAAWYRNPQQSGQSSLGVAYLDGGQYKIMRPDFIFFAAHKDGVVVADIVDPHGVHLSDALPKLRGLAAYAKDHGTTYRRIESIAVVGGKLRVLDLTDAAVREAIADANDAKGLFSGALASDYA